MTTDTGARTSVLAKLTASVMEEKKQAARALTPVAGEHRPAPRAAVLPHTKALFPNDIPQEVIEGKVAELSLIIEHLTEARDALMRVVEMPIAIEASDPDAVQKEVERAADETFAARQDRLAAEAQAAVFSKPAKPAPLTAENSIDADAVVPVSWLCPVHGKAVGKTSSKGRAFIGCPDCNQFQR